MTDFDSIPSGLTAPGPLATAESIRDGLDQIFRRRGWVPERLPQKQIWTFPVRGAGLTYRCYLQVDPELAQVVFYGVLPFGATPPVREQTAVALAAINYGLALGKFELDLSDGELRFSTGIEVPGTRLDPLVLDTLLTRALEMLDAYGPLLREQLSLQPRS